MEWNGMHSFTPIGLPRVPSLLSWLEQYHFPRLHTCNLTAAHRPKRTIDPVDYLVAGWTCGGCLCLCLDGDGRKRCWY